MSLANTVGNADLEQMYLNFDPSLDVNQLTFAYDNSSTGPEANNQGNNGIFTGVDAFQADDLPLGPALDEEPPIV